MKIIRFIRWFRGLGHAQGFGIQSPFAYHFIREICSSGASVCKEDRITYIRNKVDCLTADFKDAPGNQVFIMENVYISRKKYREWKNLAKNPDIDVTFDFLCICVAIKRQGLSKKNYIVNY